MKKQLKSFAVTASSIISLLAITFTTAAATPSATNTAKLASTSNPGDVSDRPAAQACRAMEASEVYWVTLTEDGEVDETVESYPDETTKVTAAFDYNCIPRRTTLLTIWSIDGEQVLTSEDTPRATNTANTWTHSVFMKDDSPLPNGEYSVEFYVGEDLLTSGTVQVGGDGPGPDPDPAADVTVQGTVVDSRSKRGINGALIIFLQEGVDAEQWLEDGTDEDVLAFGKTDSSGEFELNNRVPTGVAYPLLIGAKGYRTILEPEFIIEEGSEDPFVLDVKLQRQK